VNLSDNYIKLNLILALERLASTHPSVKRDLEEKQRDPVDLAQPSELAKQISPT